MAHKHEWMAIVNKDGWRRVVCTCGAHMRVAEIEDRLNDYEQLEAEVERLRGWIRWILHLHHDISKDGTPVTDAEWRACLEEGKRIDALQESDDE